MSKQDRVLAHLKAGKTLTGLEAIELFNLYRLSSAIENLRFDGWQIETEMVKGKDSRYGRYKLKSKRRWDVPNTNKC